VTGLPPIVAVFNHKGGVAKTTSAANIAACLAAFGLRVVLLDLDAQGNATAGFGVLPLPPAGAYDVLLGLSGIEPVLVATSYPGLLLLPATADLRMAELQLAAEEHSHLQLRNALERHGLAQWADVAVIDCPPSLGMVTANALTAASAVLIPARPDPFTHEGLVNTWHEIRRLRETVNPGLSVAGILLTMTTDDSTEADVARTMRAEFGENVYPTGIEADPKVVEATQLGVPVAVLDPDGGAGHAYAVTTAELLRRLTRTQPLPETTGLDAALNTLRDWRARLPALQRLPTGAEAWTAVAQAQDDAEPHGDWTPDRLSGPPAAAAFRPGMPGLAAAFLAGMLAGGVLVRVLL
jgi:chromosome partitioning protein